MTDRPFDPGLQPERTLLSWRRTCLALAVASLVSVRFAAEVLGGAALAFGVIGVVMAIAAYIAAGHRYRRAHRALSRAGELPTDGSALLLMLGALVTVGAACAVYVVGIAASRL
ncbi:DUF202 domain-containing protein [Microbacterium sp. SSW1-59]|uniref:DUF202 domain-containing protein n=1 Tax=Microbacterium xanthum TaxID=3079794 RepID=UPI002AD36070|nr:DUF202 domain-containing protein [Microbacterium sp. SSW1-59]MDZ8201045.1 DUF202 domain-containing protein [Microbacterium sp. SSW1-59]